MQIEDEKFLASINLAEEAVYNVLEDLVDPFDEITEYSILFPFSQPRIDKLNGADRGI